MVTKRLTAQYSLNFRSIFNQKFVLGLFFTIKKPAKKAGLWIKTCLPVFFFYKTPGFSEHLFKKN